MTIQPPARAPGIVQCKTAIPLSDANLLGLSEGQPSREITQHRTSPSDTARMSVKLGFIMTAPAREASGMQRQHRSADLGNCRALSPWPHRQAQQIRAWPPASHSTLRCTISMDVKLGGSMSDEATRTRVAYANR